MSNPDAKAWHQKALVIDGHCDSLARVVRESVDLAERQSDGHLDLPRLREGGVTAQIFAVFTARMDRPVVFDPLDLALCMVDALYQQIAAHPDQLMLATSARDIEQAQAEGKVAAILGLEGGEPLGEDRQWSERWDQPRLDRLRMFYRLGVRNIGLTWSTRNALADGVFEAQTGGGLSKYGRAVVQEMNRLGIVVDIAHLAPAGVRDVLALTEMPIIASHANARTVYDNPRNLTDEQLEAVARNGGVVGVTFVPGFIDAECVTLDRLLDHIDHIVRVAGIDHVGLGSDFDGYGSNNQMPEVRDAADVPVITAGLVARGYAEADVLKFLGQNYLRVFRQVWGA
ncbi:MAG: dipeptidase [Chloroflexi bacterium]|nr:dipeptidase [Chloroflexota bacterium]MBU1749228.1 dipeptidase [Chloroflexota bacterium]